MLRKLKNMLCSAGIIVKLFIAAAFAAVASLWWAISERRARRKAERALDVQQRLSESAARRSEAVDAARASAAKKRAEIEVALAVEEVASAVAKASAENRILTAKEEFETTGTATAESQRLFDEMKRSGRL